MKTPREIAAEAGIEWIGQIGQVSAAALEAIPRPLAYRYSVMPLELEDKRLRVALANPFDFDVIDALSKELRYEVEPVVAPSGEIVRALIHYYGEL